WAIAAASTRPAAPSLARMLETWTLAVLGLMNNAWAVWRVVGPAATSAGTSPSRRGRPRWGAGGGALAAGAGGGGGRWGGAGPGRGRWGRAGRGRVSRRRAGGRPAGR